jgi:hypothetical protein
MLWSDRFFTRIVIPVREPDFVSPGPLIEIENWGRLPFA